jgi:8-oxo-dGTP pyrophosphatase MutT (NUDIX family)
MSSARSEQAATIPFLHRQGTVKVCLIRRRGSDFWGLPKGTVDPGESLPKTALKESWEEAGLLGRLCGGPIGTYRYEEWGQTLDVAVYLMEVIAHEDEWDEAEIRERRWFTLPEATRLLSSHPAQQLLGRASALLGGPPDQWRRP